MNAAGLQGVLILLGVAVALVALFRRLHVPQILAYLCAGILVGPHGFGWVTLEAEWRYLAEFGLVFLMFTLGLEFSLPKLLGMKGIVFGIGGAQVVLSCLAFALAAMFFGIPADGALAIGGVLAMSSTAIVVRLLVEQLAQNSRHGRHAIGVLLFQDLVVVLFLILIPSLGSEARPPLLATLAWALIKSAFVLGAMIVVGRWFVRPLLHAVASARLREYFMFAVLLLTLAAAAITEAAGLSLALGAFLAGMMLGETEYRHQVEADILPFRDVLLGLFFITVGMMLDLTVVRTHWPMVLACVAGILMVKTAVIAGVGKLFRLETGVALRTGLVLSQVGEFGLALLLQARQHRVLDETIAQIVLAAIVLTMLSAPFIVWYSGRLTRQLVPGYERARAPDLEAIRREADARRPHVIICGYGRSGQNLAWMLEQEDIASFALDLDPVRVRDARNAGKSVVYGDAARRDVLEAAGIGHAAALAVSFNDAGTALKILEIARRRRPEMPVIVRTMDDADLERLMQAGATEVIPESLEGSLMMGSHLLLLLGVSTVRIERHVREVRRDRYRMLRGFFHGGSMFGEQPGEAYRERLHAVTLPAGAYAVEKQLAQLRLDELGVTVSALRRQGKQAPTPTPDTRVAAGDVLVLYGAPAALERAEDILIGGARHGF